MKTNSKQTARVAAQKAAGDRGRFGELDHSANDVQLDDPGNADLIRILDDPTAEHPAVGALKAGDHAVVWGFANQQAYPMGAGGPHECTVESVTDPDRNNMVTIHTLDGRSLYAKSYARCARTRPITADQQPGSDEAAQLHLELGAATPSIPIPTERLYLTEGSQLSKAAVVWAYGPDDPGDVETYDQMVEAWGEPIGRLRAVVAALHEWELGESALVREFAAAADVASAGTEAFPQ